MLTPKRYAIKELFGPTIQGEAAMAGTPCRFIRFSGCNMWDGRLETRAASQCPYCDTDFFGGTLMTASEIVRGLWHLVGSQTRWVWISGGEPMLQLDRNLLMTLHDEGYLMGVETNGTQSMHGVAHLFDHITVSPKVPWDQLRVRSAHTLKLLYPHPNPLITPEAMQDFTADAKYLQPIDTFTENGNQANLQATIAKLHTLVGWRLSLQTHKYLGLS